MMFIDEGLHTAKGRSLFRLPDDSGGARETGTQIRQNRNLRTVQDDSVPVYVSGVSSSGGSSVSQDYLLPPILELLAEGRARRQAQRDAISGAIGGLLQALPMAAPSANAIFPGFEKGGIADVLMGIISGEGTKAGGATMEGLRRPGTTAIPISALLGITEPGVGEEAGGLMALAQAILGGGKTVQTGSSSQGSSSTNYNQVQGGAGGLDPMTMALLSALLGGQPGGGGSQSGGAGYGYNPDTGQLYFPQPTSAPVPSPTYGS